MSNWLAPTCSGKLDAQISIPGSKSQTNRALVLSALASHQGYPGSILMNPLISRDTTLMIHALQQLGFHLTATDNCLSITGRLSPKANVHINCGLAGTVLRFLPGLVGFSTQTVFFEGDPQAHSRPIAPLLHALTQLGINVTGDHLPFSISGRGYVEGGHVTLDASLSSQFISGLLLMGPLCERGLTVVHQGSSLPSIPHINMTIQMLTQAGIDVDEPVIHQWEVPHGILRAHHWLIEPDLSNALPFLAAGIVTASKISIDQWPEYSIQPSQRIYDLLTLLGAEIHYTDTQLVVIGPSDYGGFEINLHDIGELTPVVAALAALSSPGSISRLYGIAHLRGHETDRLAALSCELNRLGGRCEQTDDGLVITSTPLHGGCWHTYSDHRMATAGAILGLCVPEIEVENIATVDKTFPDFPILWSKMLSQKAV